MNPKDQLTETLKTMRAIVKKSRAENRDLTDAEIDELETLNDRADALRERIAAGEKSRALMDRIAAVKGDGYEPIGHGSPAPTPGRQWAQKAIDGLRTLSRSESGAKGLVSGTVSVPAVLSPVTIDTPPRTILDLIPVATSVRLGDDDEFGVLQRRAGNVFSYVRQTFRQNNAGAVPDLAEKPVTEYTFGQVEDTFRVYANKTEDLPWRYLADYSDLIDIVSVQLRDDTLAAIERDVLSGDGEHDRFRGILETPGVQVQLYSGDLLSTLSAAKYKLLAQDRQLTGWALNPLDLQALEMLRENGTTGAFLFKSRADIEGFLGAPVVTSLGLPTGQAIAADWKQAELLPVGDDELVFDGKNRTENNTFRLMFEGRYGFRILKPFDFVRVSLIEG